jgi:hypothetical protein
MTTTTEYAARHRAAEPFMSAAARTVAEIAIAAWSAILSRRAIARVILGASLGALIFLGFGALILSGPLPSGATPAPAPGPAVVTPSPTPHPGGWTYTPR